MNIMENNITINTGNKIQGFFIRCRFSNKRKYPYKL